MISDRRRRPRHLGALLCLATATLLAACGGGDEPPVAAPSPPPSAPPGPSEEPTPPPPTSPLTGRPSSGGGPVVVAKIDNTSAAHPQAGVDAADVVYIEQVESGLTRLAAVYASTLPKSIGPVRSARITDLELVRPYGNVAFAYSGANSAFVPSIRKAPLIDLSADRIASIYRRESGRRAPYNLFADGARLRAAAKSAAKAGDVGFRFGDPLPGGKPAGTVTASYTAARAAFTWSPNAKRWLWSMDGRPSRSPAGQQLGGATVVVQYVTVTGSPYRDVNGATTPYSRTVGTGDALVLRDGRSWKATWTRPTAKSGTVYKVGAQRATFAPGQVWVLLVPKDRRATVSAP